MDNILINPDDLSHHHLFCHLTEEQLASVIHTSRLVHLAPKEKLFDRGDDAHYFYVLKEGQMKLFSLSKEGDEKIVEIVQPGMSFAEAVMFMKHQSYPVYAEAIEASNVIAIDMKTYRTMLRSSYDTCLTVMADMSRRLHRRLDEISAMALQNAKFRFVYFLLDQIPEGAIGSSSIHLSTPKNIIASRLSIQPETLSRILSGLKKQGLIEVSGNDIIMQDLEGLRELLS